MMIDFSQIREEPLYGEIESFFRKHKVDPEVSSVLVACSGGPDSTALLVLVKVFFDTMGGSVGCAHFNHGIRVSEEGDADRECVQSLCRLLNCPVDFVNYAQGSLETEARQNGQSTESYARMLRYCFFEDLLKEKGYSFLALGHTADDQIETVIQRFFQGSGVFGLQGIPVFAPPKLRPLSNVKKSDLLQFLHKYQIPYRNDISNQQDLYLRNRIRHHLIPAISEVFPGFENSLKMFHHKIDLYHSLIENQLKKCPAWEKRENRWEFPLKSFTELDDAVRLEVVFRFLNDRGIGRDRLSFRMISQVLTSRPQGVMIKAGGWVLGADKRVLFWTRDIVVSSKKSYLMVVAEDGDFRLPEFHLRINSVYGIPDDQSLFFSIDKIVHPLVVRTRREGDRICLNQGVVKIKELLNEWSVPVDVRDRIPVIEDCTGIIGIAASWLGYKDRICADHKIDKEKGGRYRLIEMNFSKNAELELDSGTRG